LRAAGVLTAPKFGAAGAATIAAPRLITVSCARFAQPAMAVATEHAACDSVL